MELFNCQRRLLINARQAVVNLRFMCSMYKSFERRLSSTNLEPFTGNFFLTKKLFSSKVSTPDIAAHLIKIKTHWTEFVKLLDIVQNKSGEKTLLMLKFLNDIFLRVIQFLATRHVRIKYLWIFTKLFNYTLVNCYISLSLSLTVINVHVIKNSSKHLLEFFFKLPEMLECFVWRPSDGKHFMYVVLNLMLIILLYYVVLSRFIKIYICIKHTPCSLLFFCYKLQIKEADEARARVLKKA